MPSFRATTATEAGLLQHVRNVSFAPAGFLTSSTIERLPVDGDTLEASERWRTHAEPLGDLAASLRALAQPMRPRGRCRRCTRPAPAGARARSLPACRGRTTPRRCRATRWRAQRRPAAVAPAARGAPVVPRWPTYAAAYRTARRSVRSTSSRPRAGVTRHAVRDRRRRTSQTSGGTRDPLPADRPRRRRAASRRACRDHCPPSLGDVSSSP